MFLNPVCRRKRPTQDVPRETYEAIHADSPGRLDAIERQRGLAPVPPRSGLAQNSVADRPMRGLLALACSRYECWWAFTSRRRAATTVWPGVCAMR